MRRTSVALLIVALAALCFGPASVWAEGESASCLVVPASDLGFVRLTGYTLEANLLSGGSEQRIAIEQRYLLLNSDRVKGRTLLLGLSAPDPTAQLYDGDGQELAQAEDAGDQWQLALGANSSKTVVLSQQRDLGGAPILSWGWDLAPLDRWHDVDSVRVTLCLPQVDSEGMLLKLSPGPNESDGRCASWSYESPTSLSPFDILFYSDSAWQQMQTLSRTARHLELAQLYDALDESAQELGIQGYDRSPEVLAQLLLAVQANPADSASRLALADWYQQHAQGQNDRALNYVLLAAEQLESSLKDGDPQQLMPRLAALYQRGARLAQDLGQMNRSLELLEQAQRYDALSSQAQGEAAEEVILRWGVDMAKRGNVEQAITQLEGRLSPRMGDLLTRYVPPLRGVEIKVELTPEMRQVRYRFQPYALSSDALTARLRAIVDTLDTLPQAEAALVAPAEGEQPILTVSTSYRRLADLAETAGAILDLLEPDSSLIDACIAQPWSTLPSAYGIQRELLTHSERYVELVDLATLAEQWHQSAQYASWQLSEISNTAPVDERAALEQELAIQALRQQLYAWQAIPLLSHWHYACEIGETTRDWRIGWGQSRELVHDQSRRQWRLTAQLLAMGIALLVLAGLLIRWLLKRRASRHPRW